MAESLDLGEQASARVSSVLESGQYLQQGEPRQGDGVDESALGHVMPVFRDRKFRCLAHVRRILDRAADQHSRYEAARGGSNVLGAIGRGASLAERGSDSLVRSGP